MDVHRAIREANTLLPGEPVEAGSDPRWQAIIAVGEFIESEPEEVWQFIRRWGGHPQEDLRSAVATVLLEHLLEQHFAGYFSRVEQIASAYHVPAANHLLELAHNVANLPYRGGRLSVHPLFFPAKSHSLARSFPFAAMVQGARRAAPRTTTPS
ncbi:MAG TPA: hypothetical protein VKU02_30500 [Gemmataceae bacterium]|nr:hypothetical protein [Gemmataceae bacterium]